MTILGHDVIDRKTGEMIGRARRSTANMTTEEFGAFTEKCCAFLADLGIIVPEPSTMGFVPPKPAARRCDESDDRS